MSYDVTGAQASRPSGDTVGVPIRFNAHNDSTVSGGLAADRAERRAGIEDVSLVEWSRDSSLRVGGTGDAPLRSRKEPSP